VGEGYEQNVSGLTRLRIALPGFRQWFGPCVFADRGIKTIDDVKPRTTFVVPVAATTEVHFYQAFRRYMDMTPEELIMIGHASFPGAYRAFGQGQADLVFTAPESPNTLAWLTGPHGLRFLDMPEDPEAEARWDEWLPDVPFSRVPEGYGPKDFWGIRMPNNYWCATALAELDADVVYNLVKWIDENYKRIEPLTFYTADMTLELLRESLDYAFCGVHDGTIRYLKEKGMWTAADDARNEYNCWLNDQYIEAYTTAMKMADEKGLQVTPDNEEWVQLWKDYKKELGLPRLRIMTDAEIADALAKIK